MIASTRTRHAAIAVASAALLGLAAAACSSSSSSTQQSATTTQTITFAISGLGSEGQYTETQVKNFEKQNPNIHVVVDILSSDSTVFLSQVNNSFASGSPTPDLVESDITYTAKWAAAG
jgi:multiple sugar transport system substrate-binding protein